MGQFLDYLSSILTLNKQPVKEEKTSKVHFADAFTSPFSSLLSSSSSNANSNNHKTDLNDKANKILQLGQSNRFTIYTFIGLGMLACLAHFVMVSAPNIKFDEVHLLKLESLEHLTLGFIPLVTYAAALSAMLEINRPVSSCVRLTSKNAGLDFRNNQFVQSLKLLVICMIISQSISLFSNDIRVLWMTIPMVSIWCYKLTMAVAHAEQQRYAPSPKKPWVGLNLSRSPKSASPNPSPLKVKTPTIVERPNVEKQVPVDATPRTRTRRAVKNIITGVSDKYQAFEQNVAHQISQKIFKPLSPKMKAVE